MTHQKCRVFDPVSFDKNDGASLPVLVVGPDWPDLDFFFRPKIRGRTRILARWQRSAQGWGAPPGRTPPGGSPGPGRPLSRPSASRGPQRAPVWPAGRTGLQARLNTPASYLHPTTRQKSNYVTKIQLVNKNPTMSQKSNYPTKTQLLNKNPTIPQKPNYVTNTRLCHKNPTIPQTPNYVTKTRLSHRHPTVPQTPDVSPDTRCQGRPPM